MAYNDGHDDGDDDDVIRVLATAAEAPLSAHTSRQCQLVGKETVM